MENRQSSTQAEEYLHAIKELMEVVRRVLVNSYGIGVLTPEDFTFAVHRGFQAWCMMGVVGFEEREGLALFALRHRMLEAGTLKELLVIPTPYNVRGAWVPLDLTVEELMGAGAR